jgi:hypothetical protein
MINKCGWCGRRIYPWSQSIVQTMYGKRHITCHIAKNLSVHKTAQLSNRLETT